MSQLCICNDCCTRADKVTCYCGGMCTMRTPILNAVRRHRQWPRTFSSINLAETVYRYKCPMVEHEFRSGGGYQPNNFDQYTYRALQTSSLVMDRDFHLMFDVRFRFGLGNNSENVTITGFVQLIHTDEVAKRLRFIGDSQYFKMLGEDVFTISHDLMTTIDENLFVGTRHAKIESFDLRNNEWFGTDYELVKNTVLKFECFIHLDCAPFCDTSLGYCPACLDGEITLKKPKLSTEDAASGDDEDIDDYSKPVSREIPLPIAISSDGGDIPPSGKVLIITPKGPFVTTRKCPGAPVKAHRRLPSASLASRVAQRLAVGPDGCTKHCETCGEDHGAACSPS